MRSEGRHRFVDGAKKHTVIDSASASVPGTDEADDGITSLNRRITKVVALCSRAYLSDSKNGCFRLSVVDLPEHSDTGNGRVAPGSPMFGEFELSICSSPSSERKSMAGHPIPHVIDAADTVDDI